MMRPQSQLRQGEHDRPVKARRSNLFDLAYQRIEDQLVSCTLAPGRYLTMQDLQDVTGLGRTPVHHAVNRLAADTLILVRPRHGLQIAPINLARERLLLKLRRDMERFVVRLATERASTLQRRQLFEMEHQLRDGRTQMTLPSFNTLDRDIDRLILDAANETFLAHTLRPLHTLFRRIGYIHHTCIPGNAKLDSTIDHHRAVLKAIADGNAVRAEAASDALIDYVDGMFDEMEDAIEPSLLDSSLDRPAGHRIASAATLNPAVRTGLQQSTSP